jgi:hypothetical protein
MDHEHPDHRQQREDRELRRQEDADRMFDGEPMVLRKVRER